MRLTRREFNTLLALSLGLGATGLAANGASAAAPPTTEAGLIGSLLNTLNPALPLHPILQSGALTEPTKTVEVILQKSSNSLNILSLLGGTGQVLEDFPFVKSHLIRIQQGALLQLALNKDVLYIAPNAAVTLATALDPAQLQTTYPRTIGATTVWNGPAGLATTGAGVAVAVLDSGLTVGADFGTGVIAVNLNKKATSVADAYGHGTHVAGIIKGSSTGGTYVGVAPGVTLISGKIADDTGATSTVDLLRGLQWIYTNRTGVQGSGPIKVVSLSLTVNTPESYKTSVVCAAVELLWQAGIVVVCAAGNRGTDKNATWFPPSNDPYVITVGATDEAGSPDPIDDTLAPFSSRGKTQDGIAKPEVVAPGRRIIAPLASATCMIAKLYPDRLTGDGHIRLSGTSMAAPVVAGAVALIRALYPNLTPDQVKWLLVNKPTTTYKGADGVPLISAAAALAWAKEPKNTVGKANQGLTPTRNLLSLDLLGVLSSASFNQAYWDQAYWDQAYWDASLAND